MEAQHWLMSALRAAMTEASWQDLLEEYKGCKMVCQKRSLLHYLNNSCFATSFQTSINLQACWPVVITHLIMMWLAINIFSPWSVLVWHDVAAAACGACIAWSACRHRLLSRDKSPRQDQTGCVECASCQIEWISLFFIAQRTASSGHMCTSFGPLAVLCYCAKPES